MVGISVDGINYIWLYRDNDLKRKSLEDHIYYTLADLWHNGDGKYNSNAEYFSFILSGNERIGDENVKYTNVLYDHTSNFTQELNYINGCVT